MTGLASAMLTEYDQRNSAAWEAYHAHQAATEAAEAEAAGAEAAVAEATKPQGVAPVEVIPSALRSLFGRLSGIRHRSLLALEIKKRMSPPISRSPILTFV
jgi:hypothetical protein